MKKLLFGILCFFGLIINVYAYESSFHIDIDKIDINAKGDNLISGLDRSFKIDTTNFSNDNVVVNKEIEELTKKLIDISFSDKSVAEKQKKFSDYLYIDKEDGTNSLTSALFVETYLKSLDEMEIKYEYIKVIRVVEFEKGLLSFAYLPDVTINAEKKDMVVTFWFINNQIHYAWYSLDDDLQSYFKALGDQENSGDVIGGTYKNISLSGQKVDVDEALLTKLYNENVESSFQITGMSNGGESVYGSAFAIRKGIVVTTWSLFVQFLSESEFLYVNDNKGNTYIVEGVVAADTNYDVVVLKLAQEVGKPVKFGDSTSLKLDQKLFTINSKVNNSFSINYGSFVKNEKGKLKNLFAITNSDVGSALYNSNGEVVGFNTAEVLNSDLSYANSTDYLKKLQVTLDSIIFDGIKAKDLESFKATYYQPLDEEKVYSSLNEETLDKLLKLHKLKDAIDLPLVKSSYKNKILSLRYKNNASESLGTMYLVNEYESVLKEQGYVNTLDTLEKKIYKNNKYQIIIKENMSYLIILIVEV